MNCLNCFKTPAKLKVEATKKSFRELFSLEKNLTEQILEREKHKETVRIQTFLSNQHRITFSEITIRNLAKEGFYCIKDNKVRCFSCGLTLTLGTLEDFSEKHHEQSKKCTMLEENTRKSSSNVVSLENGNEKPNHTKGAYHAVYDFDYQMQETTTNYDTEALFQPGKFQYTSL